MNKSAANSFLDFLLSLEGNYIMATVRLTEILNLLALFQNFKAVDLISKVFGLFNQKMLSNDHFNYFLIFLKIFQEKTGGFFP